MDEFDFEVLRRAVLGGLVRFNFVSVIPGAGNELIAKLISKRSILINTQNIYVHLQKFLLSSQFASISPLPTTVTLSQLEK